MTPIWVVNAGSSSLKVGLYAAGKDRPLWDGTTDGNDAAALRKALDEAKQKTGVTPTIVGHRIVHGGPSLATHQRITADVKRALRECEHFAPLHIPMSLALVEAVEALLPDATQVACFDTVFHRELPEVARRLPLPDRWPGVRRYGFHGLSYESIVAQLDPVPSRLVIAHLGSGASLCAVKDGKSVDTTMGLTPTGGIPMSTRSGDLDPGAIVYLLRQGVRVDELEQLLNHGSGLQALADEHDMRKLEARGDAGALLAIDAFTTAVAKTIAAYTIVLGGIDRLVFTGGIGEHSERVRRDVLARLRPLGSIDHVVLPAQEDLQIARHCAQLL